MPIKTFKKSILIFWALWWLIALWTDIVGLLAHQGFLMKSWAPDTNFPFLIAALKMYSVPAWIPMLLFLAILMWSCLAAISFCWASSAIFKEDVVWMRRADIAFVISISYWLAFFLADQLVMKFDLEENHMVQGGFQLLTFLSLHLLPNDSFKSN